MVRVLKPSGSIWVNLGDKYASYEGNRGSGQNGIQGKDDHGRNVKPGGVGLSGGGAVRAKSLMGIPWRYALRCIDELGLILRRDQVWEKPNGLPESVTDRFRSSHEYWFHFVTQPRYYSAVDEVREPHTHSANGATFGGKKGDGARVGSGERTYGHNVYNQLNPLGKLPGSVWSIPTQPLTVPPELGVDHFAAFPMEWPRRLIRAFCPAGVCTACGQGRRPVSVTDRTRNRRGRQFNVLDRQGRGIDTQGLGWESTTTITGYACLCPEPTALTAPGVVLDPFGGTGTTTLVAKALGRHGISVDMSADYCRLATWRTTDRGQMASALQVEKPAEVHPDQMDLFGT